MIKASLWKRLQRLEALVQPATREPEFMTIRFIAPGGEVKSSKLIQMDTNVVLKRRGGRRRANL